MVNRSVSTFCVPLAVVALMALGTTALSPFTSAASAAGSNGGAAPATTASGSDPLYAWGYNYYGELGDGTNSGPQKCGGVSPCSTTPVQVSLPSGVTATAIAGGSSAAYAIGSNGKVYAWGDNDFGELGDGTVTASSTPVVVSLPSGVTPTAIAAGFFNGYAIGSDGNLYAWGDNTFNQLGDGDISPDTCTRAPFCSTTPVRVLLPSGVTPTAIDGSGNTAFAIGSDGKLYAWGDNTYGTLGDGATTYRSSATPVVVPLPSGVTPKAIAGGLAAYAIGSDGNLYAWGDNSYGQLGDGTSTGPQMCPTEPATPCSTIPVEVSLPSGVTPTAIAAGSISGYAIGSDKNIYAWGDGYGSTPVVVSLPSGVTPTAIGGGAFDGYAIGSDKNIYAWGDGAYGELGNGTTTGSATQVVVSFPPGSTPEILSTEPESISAYAIGTNPSPTAPVITSTCPTTVYQGSPYTCPVTATGFPTPSLSASGAPSGISFTDNGNGTGSLSGPPTESGSFPVTITASNGVGVPATQAFTLMVNPSTAPVITTDPLNQRVYSGATATFTAAASGTPTPTVVWQVSVNGGATWIDTAVTTTTISGMPNAFENGWEFRAVFTNGGGSATTNAVTLTVT
jgi:alpha-tubulin suppressor-like RCC1 family protein